MRFLFYHGKINPVGVRNVETIINSAYNEGEKEITLCISSEGGDVNSGIGLFNFIQMFPVSINTHVAGICSSIAVTVTLAGKLKTASPLSSFCTHQATYVEGPLINIRAPNTDLISMPFKSVANWTDDEINQRFGPSEFMFNADEAIRFRVIDKIWSPVMNPGDTMTIVSIP